MTRAKQLKALNPNHPREAEYNVNEPLELVFTDLIGPLDNQAALGGYTYIAKFTDLFSRFKAAHFIESKRDALYTLRRFIEDVATPTGRRVHRLRSDGGGEYTSDSFRDYCKATGVVQEFAAPSTSQQNGVSERDGRTIMDVIRCLLNEAQLPCFLWGETCATAYS